LDTIVLQHSIIDPDILSLNFQNWLRSHSFNDKVIITVRTVLVTLFKLLRVFSKAFLAFLARKCLVANLVGSFCQKEGYYVDAPYHVGLLEEWMIFLLIMALGTVEPFPTYR
jgi:hypothetical protein